MRELEFSLEKGFPLRGCARSALIRAFAFFDATRAKKAKLREKLNARLADNGPRREKK